MALSFDHHGLGALPTTQPPPVSEHQRRCKAVTPTNGVDISLLIHHWTSDRRDIGLYAGFIIITFVKVVVVAV